MKATLQAQHLSQITGSVKAEPEGNFTRVTVTFSKPPPHQQAITLMDGAQCTDQRVRTGSTIALNPPQGQVSSTLIQVPFSAFSSHSHTVDIRDATSNASFEQACGRF
jgi:hypothetical protein